MLTLILLSLVSALGYWFFLLPYSHWKNRKIPGPKPKLIIGNIPSFFHNKYNFVYDYKKIFDEYRGKYPMIGMFLARTPQLMALEPELVKNILTKDQKSFKENFYARTIKHKEDKIFGPNLFLLHYNEWKTKRQELTPAFSMSKVKANYPKFSAIAKQLVDYVVNSNDKTFNAKELSTRFTAQISCSVVFGAEANAFTDSDPVIRKYASNLLGDDLTGYFQRVQLFSFWSKLFRVRFASMEVQEFFEHMTQQSLDQRAGTSGQGDYLEFLMTLMKKKNLKPVDMVGDAINFFIDAYETSSIFMTSVLYYIAQNKRIQEKLRDEITTVDGTEWDHDKIESLQYLDQCITEALRLHPAIVNLVKVATEDYTYVAGDGKKWLIEKGTPVNLPLFAIQRDATIYDDPDTFNPERFDPETGTPAREYKTQCTLIPFGEGPRQCIGMKFSTAEVKCGVVELIRNFELELNKKSSQKMELNQFSIVHLSHPMDYWIDFKPLNL